MKITKAIIKFSFFWFIASSICLISPANSVSSDNYYFLYSLGIYGNPKDINNNTEVIGDPGVGTPGGFSWTPDYGVVPLGLPAGNVQGLNDGGTIVGTTYPIPYPGYQVAFIMSSDGEITELGIPSGYRSTLGVDINNLGQALIWASTSSGVPYTYVWDDYNGWQYIGYGLPFSINELGEIAGGGYSNAWVMSQDGVKTTIGSLGGRTDAIANNNYGVVIGEGYTGPNLSGERHMFRWSDYDGFADLGPLGPQGHFTDINDLGQAVGYIDDGAFMWTETTGRVFLSDMLDPIYQDLRIRTAKAINDSGQITGEMIDGDNRYVYLMSPVAIEGLEQYPASIEIDIKPEDAENRININGHGIIPIAVMGSPFVDSYSIDPYSCSFEGLKVKLVGKSSNKILAHITDLNSDGYDDLVIQIEDSDETLVLGEGQAALSCRLYEEFGGTLLEGTDTISIVP